MRNIGVIIILFALWLLMSGIYTPMLIGLGLAASLFSLYIVRRMDAVDGARSSLQMSPIRYSGYIVWFMGEVVRANWAVTKIVLSPKMPIKQHLFLVPVTQKTELGKMLFANSITLTPGTITVRVKDDRFLVHALSFSQDDHAATADMDARVTACETEGGK